MSSYSVTPNFAGTENIVSWTLGKADSETEFKRGSFERKIYRRVEKDAVLDREKRSHVQANTCFGQSHEEP